MHVFCNPIENILFFNLFIINIAFIMLFITLFVILNREQSYKTIASSSTKIKKLFNRNIKKKKFVRGKRKSE